MPAESPIPLSAQAEDFIRLFIKWLNISAAIGPENGTYSRAVEALAQLPPAERVRVEAAILADIQAVQAQSAARAAQTPDPIPA